MKLKQISWWRALAGAFGAELVLVCAAVAWVALYSYLIHPGEPAEFYQRYAMRSSAWVGALAGIPVFYLASRWIRARVPASAGPTAMAMFGIYFLLEAPFVLLSDNPLYPYWLPYAGYAGKGVAAYLGLMCKGRPESTVREA